MALCLSRKDVSQLVSTVDVLSVVEQAHALHAKGLVQQPDRRPVRVGTAGNAFLPMAASIPDIDAVGLKILSIFPSNRQKGLPSLNAVVVLIDTNTGQCVAILEGGLLTAYRTAAASAIATKYMARSDSRVLGLVGAGLEARTHLDAIRRVRQIEKVLVWSRTRETAEKFISDMSDRGVPLQVVSSPEEVTANSDILCTLTPSKTPIVFGSWFKPGLHVNAVGTHWIDCREIDTEAVRRSYIACDSFTANELECGDVMIPVNEGAISKDHFARELGAIVSGSVVGRRSDQDITMYQSVGVAIQDVAVARLLVDAAIATGVGSQVAL